MPQITVMVNGHPYAVACDPGQEQHLRDLARLIETKMTGFAQQALRAGEARLLVLAALVIADELHEANEALRRAGTAKGRPNGEDPALAAGIEKLARRIETVAERLETAQM
jgi:cell division protein ZapA